MKKKCDCGCDTCDKAPILNESKQYAAPISEGMRYHLSNQIQLHENIFRPGSKSHIDLIHEARLLWKQGIIELQDLDKRLFETTDLGRFGLYEGKQVPLDLPLMEIEDRIPGGLAKGKTVEDIAKHHNVDVEEIKNALKKGEKVESEHTTSKDIAKEIAMDHLFEDPKYYDKLEKIEEDREKHPALGKPKRGGSKKFYVYVKDPKTKRIKKVSFGMAGGGLHAKLNNPKARQAFSKRMNCPQAKDRTKAKYWACRLPRYAKLLGFKTTFTGYW